MFTTTTKIESSKCEYLNSEEDYYRTTSYPVCTCKMKYCNKCIEYCPVRDD